MTERGDLEKSEEAAPSSPKGNKRNPSALQIPDLTSLAGRIMSQASLSIVVGQ
jgi:hypothetical protein